MVRRFVAQKATGLAPSGDQAANQDDNIKASLDLAHTDIDAIIRSLGIVRQTNSSIFYVDVGVSGATGVSWATAVLDVEAATVLCTASAGDIIVAAPGHIESMTAADDIDLDKIGVKLIGLGEGDLRPTFSYTASGTFVLGADNTAGYGNAVDVVLGAGAADIEVISGRCP